MIDRPSARRRRGDSRSSLLGVTSVVAPYVPALADWLRVNVSDTVRLMLEYKDNTRTTGASWSSSPKGTRRRALCP